MSAVAIFQLNFSFTNNISFRFIPSNIFICLLCYFIYFTASLRKLDEQPEWLKGGKLRDYQLEGLNFLVNRSVFASWRSNIGKISNLICALA